MRAKLPSDADRRGSVRVRKGLSVQYKKGLRISGLAWINATVRDISETGLCINTDGGLLKSDHLRLRLKLPIERSWLQITGTVVKSERAPRGRWTHVKFSALDALQKKEIRTYIAWVLIKEGGTP
ncbi:MAG TPA: PilZ domain-containing protein [Candidatus Omnitrophota bacterium]|nr:PilZ domain-containing protein [Candidatus Omnitrophota bacterium]HQJ15173.1 PilZ domain-containing protein [Candidatus Omnitrophota bacterium]